MSTQPAPNDPADEMLPDWDVPPPDAIPLALPVSGVVEGDIPLALPVALPVSAPPEPPPAVKAQPEAPPPPAPAVFACPACQTANPPGQPYCSDCGYYFSKADLAGGSQAPAAAPPAPLPRVLGRYELVERASERWGVERFRALDHDTQPPTPVHVVRQPLPPPAAEPLSEPSEDQPPPVEPEELLPTFDEEPAFPQTQVLTGQPSWPSIAWERRLLSTLDTPALPAQVDHFCDDTHEYLVEEAPQGQLLWDAWDDPQAGARERYGYLAQVAELLHRLHQCNAMIEGLRPDLVVIDGQGQARLTTLSEVLPLPLPDGAPVRGTLYTAPEVLSGSADARADLYGFGAMLYSLHVGRELNERTDFDGPGRPKDFLPRFPDSHPAFARLMMKTFRKEPELRFPTDEAGREDPTGCLELLRTLEVLRRTADDVRLEIAAWTSTGIVRTGNEDAFALLHAIESRQDDVGEAALILLCDGMGGYEAGEVAAALTIKSLRETLSRMPPFHVAAGASPFPGDPLSGSPASGHAGPGIDVEAVKSALRQALKEANRTVFQASRAPGSKRRGMGCTAEAVYLDGRNVVVGHVGDSRTYHLHEGRLIQMTRDQTLVNRLVELGSLSPEEAEQHPRRNELQQAIGGQPDVEPGVYAGKLSPGDWVLVCSDGLTNHVSNKDLAQMLQSEAASAEMAARRLVNLTLIEGATDNVTVVAVRAT
jgi:protein phosphatase